MKTYRFRFTVQRAEFRNGMVSVAYGLCAEGLKSNLAAEERESTFQDALAYLATLSANTPGPHAAFLRMASDKDRCPPGFKTATRKIYREDSHA